MHLIAEETKKISATASGAEREISLLHEFCTRLIADVVTGKLDVREAALWLPDESEEPEPLDETEAALEETPADVGDTDPDETAT